MKKIALIIILILIMPIVNAESVIEKEISSKGSYKNFNGVIIDKENYNKMKDIIPDEEIEYISEHFYNNVKKSKKILSSEIKYLETEYYPNILRADVVSEKEITREEYYQKQNTSPYATCTGTNCHQTASKTIRITALTLGTTGPVLISLEATWEKLPVNRSFDVLAIRLKGSTNIINYEGEQSYLKNNN